MNSLTYCAIPKAVGICKFYEFTRKVDANLLPNTIFFIYFYVNDSSFGICIDCFF